MRCFCQSNELHWLVRDQAHRVPARDAVLAGYNCLVMIGDRCTEETSAPVGFGVFTERSRSKPNWRKSP